MSRMVREGRKWKWQRRPEYFRVGSGCNSRRTWHYRGVKRKLLSSCSSVIPTSKSPMPSACLCRRCVRTFAGFSLDLAWKIAAPLWSRSLPASERGMSCLTVIICDDIVSNDGGINALRGRELVARIHAGEVELRGRRLSLGSHAEGKQ